MEISKVYKWVKEEGIIFLSYGNFLSQSMITSMTEVLEKEADAENIKMGISANLFTIFIEMTQNIMNYSKSPDPSSLEIVPSGLMIVSRDNENYYLTSQNIVDLKDKEKLIQKLEEIQTYDRAELKKRYRELRKSGANTHAKGGGIGFYEIAKRCNGIQYDFTQINEKRFYFQFHVTINL